MLCAHIFRYLCEVPPGHGISIAWTDNKCCSASVQQAFVASMLLEVVADITCYGQTYMEGKQMSVIDRLSREQATLHLDADLAVDTTSNAALQVLFRALDPTTQGRDAQPHLRVLRELHGLLLATLHSAS